MSGPHEPANPELLLRLFLDQAKDHALLLLDPQGRVVGWLMGAEHVFGYRAEEIVGQSAARLFTRAARPCGRRCPGRHRGPARGPGGRGRAPGGYSGAYGRSTGQNGGTANLDAFKD
jgi:hypothetical protein